MYRDRGKTTKHVQYIKGRLLYREQVLGREQVHPYIRCSVCPARTHTLLGQVYTRPPSPLTLYWFLIIDPGPAGQRSNCRQVTCPCLTCSPPPHLRVRHSHAPPRAWLAYSHPLLLIALIKKEKKIFLIYEENFIFFFYQCGEQCWNFRINLWELGTGWE
jgi:hypothetical protein